MKAIIIPTEGKPYAKDLDESLHALQTEVGGYIEAVGTEHEGIAIYLNEEGKIEGLPANANTEALAALKVVLMPGDYIVGNVVVVGFDLETGEDGNVPSGIINLLGVEDIEIED